MAIETKRVTAILLAAGRSVRFGADKLLEPLAGKPLWHHAAGTLGAMPFARRIAVLGPVSLDVGQFGFDAVHAPTGKPLSASVAAGVAAAESTDCDACLIALADMPLVPESHFCALLRAHETSVTATRSVALKTVPAVFARDMFSSLRALDGDRGAVALLSEAEAVPLDSIWLRDVDTTEDLARAKTLFPE